MRTFSALVKREALDGKNGYFYVPLILTGITLALVILSTLGLGNTFYLGNMENEGIHSLADAMNMAAEEDPQEMPAGMTLLYWMTTGLSWIAFPFVIFFSLLGALYEERRDRSILFWKSMPVSDWQEVLAKFFTPLIIAPLAFLGIVIAAQITIALYFSVLMLVQGGPAAALWPLGLMISSWFSFLVHYLLWMLWALPLLAWLLFVSSFAARMPFLWAILVPVVLVVVEGMFFNSNQIGSWIGLHMGAWQDGAYMSANYDIDGPRDILKVVMGGIQWQGLTYTLANLHFWFGLLVTGGFIAGAIHMRKRAV